MRPFLSVRDEWTVAARWYQMQSEIRENLTNQVAPITLQSLTEFLSETAWN